MRQLAEQSRMNGGTYNTNQFSSMDGGTDTMHKDDSSSDGHKEFIQPRKEKPN
jgi:hypothetical protein